MTMERYETPESLAQAVEEYMKGCESQGVFPDLAGMRLSLGLSREELEQYAARPGFDRVLDSARDRRESWLMRKMTGDSRGTQGCMNALKQPENGAEDSAETRDKGAKLTILFCRNMDETDFM